MTEAAERTSRRFLGTSRRRLEGGSKVTGRLRYTADLPVAGVLKAKLVLSPHASARVRGIGLDRARCAPGVVAAVAAADLGWTDSPPAPDLLLLARDRVYYGGQPLAVVLGEDESYAADGAALVELDLVPMPAMLDVLAAIEPDAPLVLRQVGETTADAAAHGTSTTSTGSRKKPHNVSAVADFTRGDAKAALDAADFVVGGRWSVPAVHQGFLETHASIARAEPDGSYTIWTATHGSVLCRNLTAEALGIDRQLVRVVPMPLGGSFGGKVALLEALAAALSRFAGRPVSIVLTRTEEFLLGGAAPAAVIDLALGADRDGGLRALQARILFDNGAGPGQAAGLAAQFLAGTYRIPNVEVTALEVCTNRTPIAAYRAPGAPQTFFALEGALDELARQLKLDPIALRLMNAIREGDARPDGGFYPRVGFLECLEQARRHPMYTAACGPEEGVGLAAGSWGGGREPAAAACSVEPDGTVVLHVGTVDLAGANTIFAMIVADAIGVQIEKVRIDLGDSTSGPFGTTAGGSKAVHAVGPAVLAAAREARRQLLEIAAEELESSADDLVVEDGRVMVRGVPSRALDVGTLAARGLATLGRNGPVWAQGRASVAEQSPMFTVHITRVRVDGTTGEIQLLGFAAIQDVGAALNPREVEGQIHGGVLQSLGRALGEGLVYDLDGNPLTVSFLDYLLPSIDQAPATDVQLVEVPSPVNPFGARGAGEPPAIPAAAALANAVAAASGIRLYDLPISWEKLIRS